MTSPITEADYAAALNSNGNTTVGGVSGLTYAMMKAFPPDVTAHVVHAINALFLARNTPNFWRWRWLCPKPKVTTNVTLADLRPLVLVEVTRKIAVAVVIRRIQHIWAKHDLLLHTQHAFCARHGTDTALIQLIHAMSEARESCSEIFLSSWDLKRAFDSVAKPVQVLSWYRLGLHPDDAHYLSNMDLHSRTIIRTPLAQDAWTSHKYKGFTHHITKQPHARFPRTPGSLNPDRGVGQGDVHSPHTWRGLFDILMTALAAITVDQFLTRSSQGIAPSHDGAYADDTVSVSATFRAMQAKADIVSAFCIVFGLAINADKLRLFHFNYSAQDPTREDPPDLIIHGPGWTPHAVPIKQHGAIKHLGVHIDGNGDQLSTTQLDLTSARLKRECNIIAASRAPATDKALALKVSTYNRASYALKFTNVSLKALQTLDATVSKCFRRITNNPPSFPASLLYNTPNRLGLNLCLFSDHVNNEKATLLHRCTHSDDATNHAADGILTACIRANNLRLHPQQSADILPGGPLPLLPNSLLEQRHLAGITLRRGGTPITACLDLILTDVETHTGRTITPAQCSALGLIGIYTLADILSPADTPDTYLVDDHVRTIWPDILHWRSPPNFSNITLRAESTIWSIADSNLTHYSPDDLFEILGLDLTHDEAYIIRIYQYIGLHPHSGKRRYIVHPDTLPLGGGTQISNTSSNTTHKPARSSPRISSLTPPSQYRSNSSSYPNASRRYGATSSRSTSTAHDLPGGIPSTTSTATA